MSRTEQEIKDEYQKVSAAAGALYYQVEAEKQQLNVILQKMSELNTEMQQLKQAEQPMLKEVKDESAKS